MNTQEKQINLDDPIEARAANTMNTKMNTEQTIIEQIRLGKRLIYEHLIKGSKNEAELKEKDDTHVEQVLKAFNIKFDYR